MRSWALSRCVHDPAPVDDDEGAVMASIFDDYMARMRARSDKPIVLPVDVVKVECVATANCTTCGTFAGCVCRKAEQTPMVCYLCDGPHDPRVAPPRVCGKCEARYLK